MAAERETAFRHTPQTSHAHNWECPLCQCYGFRCKHLAPLSRLGQQVIFGALRGSLAILHVTMISLHSLSAAPGVFIA